jgi:hypothetical protein
VQEVKKVDEDQRELRNEIKKMKQKSKKQLLKFAQENEALKQQLADQDAR